LSAAHYKSMPSDNQKAGDCSFGANWARVALGIISLAIYVVLALLQVQDRDAPEKAWLAYDIERSAIAGAVSNIVYGAPVASVYRGLFDEFYEPSDSLEAELEKAESKKLEPGDLIPYNPDGSGAGLIFFATAAMRTFGVHASSILWLFLVLLSVAVVAFLLRFPDGRALVTVAGLSALILMFASPLGSSMPNVSQFPVGGYRYFSLLASIPGMHIFLELVNTQRTKSAMQAIAFWSLLLIQLAIFAIALYVNLAAIYLYGPFVLGAAYALYHVRRVRTARTAQVGKLILIVAIVGATLVASRALAPKAYTDTGRNGDMIWGRIFESIGANPHWPFGTLAAEYKGCVAEEPEKTLQPGIEDFNRGCAWRKYAEQHGMSEEETSEHVLDGEYNKALRDEFFKIARTYRVETLLTFIYYKPLLLGDTLLSLFSFTERLPGWKLLLIAAQFLVLIAFALVETRSPPHMGIVGISLALGAICSCGLYIVAWSNAWTTGDLFFYLLALLAAGMVALLTSAGRLVLNPRLIFD
jgi:hypothetical protein